MQRYSGFRLLREGFRGHRGWAPLWRSPRPKAEYDVVIIGGGGQGLATAYYLAKNHGIRRVAVIERGWLGGGNTGRNTTVIRSDYYYPESFAFYDFSLRLYEGLSQELGFNTMFSQRGQLTLLHSDADIDRMTRAVNAMQINGSEITLIGKAEVAARVPLIDTSATARFPVEGALWHRRAGTGRHDAVARGYARAADALGVDIVQNCEVTGLLIEGGRCTGVETSHGTIRAGVVGSAVAGNTSTIAAMAGVAVPVTSYSLQAFVTEPLKPVLDHIVFSPGWGAYFSQSDKGGLVMGGGLDRVPSYAQRGNLPMQEAVLAALTGMAPAIARVRLLRHWAGPVDVTPDSSPLISATGLPGFCINGGWGTGGFKAIPAGGTTFAHLLATGSPHPLGRPFGLNRFAQGRLYDEGAAAGIAH